ncbi:MAG: FHA domain-containing protein [Victivallales bacterium]|nr:FHA domain-containing protein [Victivallales bacterium]
MGLKAKKDLQIRLEHEGKILFETSLSDIAADITIGRAADCTWVIPPTDRVASNHHATLSKKHGHAVIVDNKSRNGIYYKGAKVTERKLAPGDQIGIGDCRLFAELPQATGKGPEREFNRLEQLNGEKKGSMFDLSQQTVRIGTSADCEIVLNDSVISHFHASIEQRPDGSSWIRDMGSRNGTRVNGTALSGSASDSGRLLKDGDIITISYIEFKFWDKYAVHVRSHVLLKTIACILTFAILVGGYYAWLSVMPSAKHHIDLAREYARQRDFASARAHLEAAANARASEDYDAERAELMTQLGQWEDTVKKWNEVKKLLANRKWISANKILSPLLSQNMEFWRWNDTDANVSKNEAIATKRVIDAYLESRDTLEAPDADSRRLENSLNNVSAELSALQKNQPEFCNELVIFASDIRDELKLTTDQLNLIEKKLQELSALEKLETVIKDLETIRAMTEKHNDERAKKGNRFSPLVVAKARDVLEPLAKLREGKSVLDNNYAKAAIFEFSGIKRELPLPTIEECAVYPVMADKRQQILSLQKQFEDDARQLELLWKSFKSQSLEPGKIPACIEGLTDTKRLEAVLNCDCLALPLPKWSRTEPSGEYDRMLGVESFFEFLNMQPAAFDASILEERSFRPDIYQARSLYSNMELLLTFLERPSLAMIKQQPDNKVNELALYADDLIVQRDAIVSTLLERYGKSEARDGIIAGGMALLLAKPAQLPKDIQDNLQQRLRKLRQAIMALQVGEQTPEQAIAQRKKTLEIGIPGDSLVKQAWSMEHPAK